MSDKLLNLVAVLQEDLPSNNVQIHHVEVEDLDYILYGRDYYDTEEKYPRSSIDLTRVIELKDEFDVFEVKSFHSQEVHGMSDKNIGEHKVAVRVKE